MEKIKNFILYGIFLIILWLVNVLPGKIPLYLGRGVGYLIYKMIKSRREITERNLQKAFADEMTNREIKELTLEIYRNMGITLVEFMLLGKINQDNFRDFIDIKGLDFLRKAYSRGKGVIIYSAHFGNWEWLGAFISLLGFPVGALAARQHNSLFDERVNQMREEKGINIIPLGASIRNGYKWLKEGKCLLILGDQDARNHGWKINFFSRPASTYSGAVQLAQRTGAAIVPAFMVRKRWMKHRLSFKKPYTIEREANRKELKNKLQELTAITESVIREYPGQWFWLHKRWKTKFPGNNSGLKE